MSSWKDLFADSEKVFITEIAGKQFPWKKLTVEQTYLIEKRHPEPNEMSKQKVLLRLLNADNTITMSDIDRLTEDVFLRLIIDMGIQLNKEHKDFQNGAVVGKANQSTSSLNTLDTK